MHSCALHRDQLQDLSDVLASTDAMLMQRLNQLDSAECYFAYRMLLVMLRRELSLPQVGPCGYCSMTSMRASCSSAACCRMLPSYENVRDVCTATHEQS